MLWKRILFQQWLGIKRKTSRTVIFQGPESPESFMHKSPLPRHTIGKVI